jgi:hypothetical protein
VNAISPQQVRELKERLRDSDGRTRTVATVIGGCEIEGGLWRFYSSTYPAGGVEAWNMASWRTTWASLTPAIRFVGEDIFGNQLTLIDGVDECQWWSHESGDLVGLEADLGTLIDAVCEAGLGWIDVYKDRSLDVARVLLPRCGRDRHIHWVTPRILGGEVALSNTALVDRETHLIGHGKLWATLGKLPPGTEIVT